MTTTGIQVAKFMGMDKCCPWCQGNSGFIGTVTKTYTVSSNWGEAPTDDTTVQETKYGAMYCADCKRKFRCLKDIIAVGLAR